MSKPSDSKETIVIHQSKWGTYHPPPDADVSWTIEDNSGYVDAGPACDECGGCRDECQICKASGAAAHTCVEDHPELHQGMTPEDQENWGECGGISGRYFTRGDGGESLCEPCANKKYDVQIAPCDCP